MNTKKFALAVMGYIVVTFVIAATWHLVLFKGLYDQLGIFTRKEPLIPLGIVSIIMQAFVLAYLYPLFFRGGSPVKEGVKFGLLTGVLMASIAVFAEAGKQQVNSLMIWLAFESMYYLLQFSVAGIIIAVIYRKGHPQR
ncbi:MAG: hypothetical protein L0Y56_04400 [Nitrospira sp.]|nr:hypothetical protein [Nitrospira sp.]